MQSRRSSELFSLVCVVHIFCNNFSLKPLLTFAWYSVSLFLNWFHFCIIFTYFKCLSDCVIFLGSLNSNILDCSIGSESLSATC